MLIETWNATPLLWLPILFQGGLSLYDEFYLHRRRFLPRWERLGHPMDTLSLLACVLITIFFRPTPGALVGYVLACVASCMLITKDEWVHKTHATGHELWIHAILFVLHPVVCICIGCLWYAQPSGPLLKVQAGLLLGYAAYQYVYWNVVRKVGHEA